MSDVNRPLRNAALDLYRRENPVPGGDRELLAGLVGPGCPWETVQQMADELEIAQGEDYDEGWRDRLARLEAAVALLRQSGEKE